MNHDLQNAIDITKVEERMRMVEILEEVVNTKFPLGKRLWCIECAERIAERFKEML